MTSAAPGPTPGEFSAGADAGLRTFGLAQLGFSYDDIPAAAVDDLCQALVARWRGLDDEKAGHAPASLADPTALLANHFTTGLSQEDFRGKVTSRMKNLGLDVATIAGELSAVTTREMGNAPESYLLKVLAELVSNHESARGCSNPSPLGQTILDALDTLICFQSVQDLNRVCLESVLEKHLKEMAASQAAALREWVLGLVHSPKHRVAGAQQATDYMTEHLRALSREANEAVQALLPELSSLKQMLLGDRNGGRGWLQFRGFTWNRRLAADRRLCRYFRLRIEELTFERRVPAGRLHARTTVGSGRPTAEPVGRPEPHGRGIRLRRRRALPARRPAPWR